MIRQNHSVINQDVMTEVLQSIVHQEHFIEVLHCTNAVVQRDDADADNIVLTECYYVRIGTLQTPIVIETNADQFDCDFEQSYVCDTIEEAIEVVQTHNDSAAI